MPKWLMLIIGGILVCVVLAIGAGWWFSENIKVDGPLEESIAAAVSNSVSQAIALQSVQPEHLRLSASNIDINTYDCVEGEQTFTTSEDTAEICGATTTISESGIEVELLGTVYLGMPQLDGDEIAVEEVSFDKGLFGLIASSDSFERGIERGINEALEESGLKPVGVAIESTIVQIDTEKVEP